MLSVSPGCQGDHAEDLQVSWGLRELHHSDLLAAAAGVQGGGQLPEGEVPQGPEGRSPPRSRQQRGQPGGHRRDLQLHLSQGAGPPGGLPRLLPGKPHPGPAGHRGPRVPEEGQGLEQVGEAELQEAVRGVRAGRGGAQSRDGVELQLQIPLVLRGEVRAVQKDGDQVLLCEERRSEGEERERRQPPEEPEAEEEALSIFITSPPCWRHVCTRAPKLSVKLIQFQTTLFVSFVWKGKGSGMCTETQGQEDEMASFCSFWYKCI